MAAIRASVSDLSVSDAVTGVPACGFAVASGTGAVVPMLTSPMVKPRQRLVTVP